MIGIYKFTNKNDNMSYIGKSKNIEARYKAHYKTSLGSGGKTYWAHALQKYGIESFDFEVLIECPAEELNYWEKYYIKYYGSNIRGNGYNMTEGGDGISFWDEELRERQRNNFIGKPRAGTPEDWKWDDDSKKKQSERITEYFNCQESRDKASEVAYKKYEEHPELKTQIGVSVSKLWEDNDYKQNWKNKMQAHYDDPNWHGNSYSLKRKYKEDAEFAAIFPKCCEGRKKINNGIIEKTVEVNELPYYLNNGFIMGRLWHPSEESKNKMRKAKQKH